MATLDEVVAQLQKNNRSEAGRDSRHTMALNAIAKALDNQTTQTSKSDKETKDSKKKTDRDDKKSRFRQILDFGKKCPKITQPLSKISDLKLRPISRKTHPKTHI